MHVLELFTLLGIFVTGIIIGTAIHAPRNRSGGILALLVAVIIAVLAQFIGFEIRR